MTEPRQHRHRAERTRLEHFTDEVLVVCPACERCAVVRMRPLAEPKSTGPFLADEEATLTCTSCGYSARRAATVRLLNGPGDVVFDRPVWLQAACTGHTLWAYSERHLTAIEEYVRAGLRERRRDEEGGWSNASWTSRMPGWISSAKNRDQVRQCIARIRREKL